MATFGRRDFNAERSTAVQNATKTSSLPALTYGNGTPDSARVVSTFNFEAFAERLRQLEVRMAIAERSGKTVWEETVRTQSELRRAVSDVIQSGQSAAVIDAATDNLTAARLNAHLQQFTEIRSALTSQINDIRQRQQQLAARSEQFFTQLDDASRSADQLQRLSYRLTSEMQSLKGRMDSQTTQIDDLTQELRNTSILREQDNRRAVENLQFQQDKQIEQTFTQLRSQIDRRLLEMRDAMATLRDHQERSAHELRATESTAAARIAELQSNVAELTRRLNDTSNKLDAALHEQDRLTSTQYIRLQGSITESLNDAVSRAAQAEKQLRDEQNNKLARLEQLLQTERMARDKFETSTKRSQQDLWNDYKKYFEEEMQRSQQTYNNDVQKTKENMNKLNEAIELIDKSLREQRKQHERLLSAEIQSRQQQESTMTARIATIEQQLTATLSSLQKTIDDKLADKSTAEQANSVQLNEAIQQLSADLNQAIKDLTQNVDSTKELLNSTTEKVDELSRTLENNQLQSTGADSRLTELQDRTVVVENMLNDLQSDSRLVEIQEHLAKLESDSCKYENWLKDISQYQSKVDSQMLELESKVDALIENRGSAQDPDDFSVQLNNDKDDEAEEEEEEVGGNNDDGDETNEPAVNEEADAGLNNDTVGEEQTEEAEETPNENQENEATDEPPPEQEEEQTNGDNAGEENPDSTEEAGQDTSEQPEQAGDPDAEENTENTEAEADAGNEDNSNADTATENGHTEE